MSDSLERATDWLDANSGEMEGGSVHWTIFRNRLIREAA
jgi:hypothetical protein